MKPGGNTAGANEETSGCRGESRITGIGRPGGIPGVRLAVLEKPGLEGGRSLAPIKIVRRRPGIRVVYLRFRLLAGGRGESGWSGCTKWPW